MSGTGPVFAAAGSHLYPGAAGAVSGPERDGPCLVEFADGSMAFGRLEAGGAELALAGYTTARGTAIPAKRWAIAVTGAGGARRFRISRLPSS